MFTKYPQSPAKMTKAYRQLYEIETTLRYLIDRTLTETIGSHWRDCVYEKRDFDKLYYHELIPYFAKYPQLQPFYVVTDIPSLDIAKDFSINFRIQKLVDQIERQAKPQLAYSFIEHYPEYRYKIFTAIISAKAT
ncbi:hypothetical protein [Alkalihalobacterium sp. APHAB7]|uniref:hypothetical protein n=1 Tax=Alkalihalobacterium sp. APHAB7 TaxID=3402081 RepID=UPI003AAC3749